MAEYKTKAPSGLKFTRKGNAVILEWKISDSDYDAGQYVSRKIWTWKKVKKKIKKGKKTTTKYVGKSSYTQSNQSLGVKVTKFQTTINPKKYYPYTKLYLTQIGCYLQGKRATFDDNDTTYYPTWSNASSKIVKILIPRKPSLTAELDDTNYNVTTFEWLEADKNTSFNWFTDFERQTILKKDCSEKDGSKISWEGAVTKTGVIKYENVVEDSAIFQGNYSYTRWYRVRCRGPRGASEWKYARHVYAIPAYSEGVSAKVEAVNASRGYYRVNVKWKVAPTEAHPVDSTTIEYTSVTPNTRISILTDDAGVQYSHVELVPPSMSSGTSIGAIKDTGGEDGIVFSVPTKSDIDKCLVVRVNTKHDNNTAIGETTYVSSSFGNLDSPIIKSIGSVDPDTRRVSIQVENKSSVPNTHVAICYKTASEPDKVDIIGIVPSGKSEVTVILPKSSATETYSIGAYARCGDYSPLRPDLTEPTYYALTNDLIESDKVWTNGEVPQAPKAITLTSPSSGTIRVTWDWSWADATSAELSWADHKDAWESTAAPSTYVVNNTSASAWNIHGLEVGTWYVRVRLLKSEGESIVYGEYSEIAEIRLSSVPSIPSLTLSDTTITEDDQVTCYWVYATVEGSVYTPQQQAEICEATLQEDGSFVYGEVIARASTTQHLTIVAADQGWKAGETHYLAVQVTSASGETSNGWSPPVALTIASKIDIDIRETSLVEVTEIIEDDDEQVINTYYVLDKLPLAVDFGFSDPHRLSEDPVVVENKQYYVKVDDQYVDPDPFVSDPSPYYEKIVTPLSYDPSSYGYYEVDPENDLSYILTEDTSWDYAKTYYTQSTDYRLTEDLEIVEGKTYYSRSGEGTEDEPYVYTSVEEPVIEEIATYYEQYYIYTAVLAPPAVEISYELTSDIIWDDQKEYYLRSGEGTEENPYSYSVIPKPIESPLSLGYYEDKDVEGEATLIIERAESYHVGRPDESEYDGFEGETVSLIDQLNGGTAYFDLEDITGLLDDGAKYRLLVSLIDSYGQVAEAEPIEFVVHWLHQAVMPEAEVEVFDDDMYATILPLPPVGYELTQDTTVEDKKYFTRSGEGTEEDPYIYTEVSDPSGDPHESGYYQLYDYSEDRCNIYRLSADTPQLIVEDAVFGTKYVDPYPTLKSFGGYRISYRSVNCDYITEDNRLAWTDYSAQINRFLTIIDFSKSRVSLPYDLELSNKWSKDFTETKYLGGSIQGDWNPAVSRTGSVKTNTVVFEDPDTIKAMRSLATYPGICHVRTPDGSNFTANVDVSEDRENKKIGKIAKFSINVTRVDPEDLDGVTYESWISENE